jgi:hypothetical protein
MIICQYGGTVPAYNKKCFQRTIHLLTKDGETDETRQKIVLELNALMKGVPKNENIVLLFDEAQHLLQSTSGFAFRCIRWWLREKLESRPKVVAVFAGTTSALTNFFREDEGEGNFSRNGGGPTYWNFDIKKTKSPKNLYLPFFHICTIGCLSILNTKEPINDLENAAYYGALYLLTYRVKASF